MRSSFLIILALMLQCTRAESQTLIQEGAVSGTWNVAASPYQVNGEIHIPEGQTLTIEPGVRIQFQGHHRFFIYGTLMAMGTVNDSIYFTVENDTLEWCGIEFRNPVSKVPRSLIEYCVIEHSYAYSGLSEPYTSNYDMGGGIMAEYGNLTIRNCAIRDNKALIGAGIKCRGNAVIENTSFTNNEAMQKDILYIDEGAKISGCLITDNRASESIVRLLQYVLFLNNTVSENTLDSTAVAIAMIFGYPDLVNSIIYGNNVSMIYLSGGSNPRFYNCDIAGGHNSIYAEGENNGIFPGIYENNIDASPEFLDSSMGDYQLKETSPCIDAGSYLVWNPNLLTDISGEPRIADTPAQRVDMGAYEFQGSSGQDTVSAIPPAQNLVELEIYPNPVLEELNINCSAEILEYAIINLQGIPVMQGTYTDRILVGNLSKGLYILSVTYNAGTAKRLFIKQ